MPHAQLTFKARDNTAAVDDILSQITKMEGVLQVAKDATDEGCSGFVVFSSSELAAAARNRLPADSPFVLGDPAREYGQSRGGNKKGGGKKAGASSGTAAAAKAGDKSHGGVVRPTADFFNGPSPSTMRADDKVTRGGRGGGRGVAGGSRGGNSQGGRGGNTSRRGGRGGRGGNQQRTPMVTAHVACVHNVPPPVTKDQVFSAFKDCGFVLEIARSEKIALVYFKEPEHVTNAIVALNGKVFHGNPVSVCNGGEMKIPVPPPQGAAGGPPPPQAGGIPAGPIVAPQA